MDRRKQVALHLYMRASINALVKDGDPIDYQQVRSWAPLLREAAELLERWANEDEDTRCT